MEGFMWALIKQEPVLFQGLIQAALSLSIAFGTDLSGEKIGAILAFTAALLSFVTRTQVTPLVNPKDATGKPLK
jgi:hypothetical protein